MLQRTLDGYHGLHITYIRIRIFSDWKCNL